MRRAVLLAFGVLLGQPTLACSFARGYEAFTLGAVLELMAPPAPAPDVAVENIERGYDGGDLASCSDAGVLTLTVPSDSLGYRFEIVAGNLEAGVFPEGFIRTVQPGRLRFVWLDAERASQENIDVLLKITTLSETGVLSAPTLLRIRHPGGASERR